MGVLVNYYAKVDAVRICPSTKPPTVVPTTANAVGDCEHPWYWYVAASGTLPTKMSSGSYAINGWMYNDKFFRDDHSPADRYAFKKESSIQKTAQTPIFVDSVWVDMWPWEDDPPYNNL